MTQRIEASAAALTGQRPSYDFLVLIGRFQPPHRGHLALIEAALKRSQQLIVVCGSAAQPRSLRNPWSAAEREAMLLEALAPGDRERLHVVAVADVTYHELTWVAAIQAAVARVIAAQRPDGPPAAVGLIGTAGERLAHYGGLFPQWGVEAVEPCHGINGTAIRAALLQGCGDHEALSWLPPSVAQRLAAFGETAAGAALRADWEKLQAFKASWRAAPYPPVFVTVDAVVVQGGHVLLVERGHWPGCGLLALPGGFVEQHEPLLEACLRELGEETLLQLPAALLRASVRAAQVFDAPFRSARGRTITHAFLIVLPPTRTLPVVEGGDDARRAAWLPLSELPRQRLFEDHYCIIQAMLRHV